MAWSDSADLAPAVPLLLPVFYVNQLLQLCLRDHVCVYFDRPLAAMHACYIQLLQGYMSGLSLP